MTKKEFEKKIDDFKNRLRRDIVVGYESFADFALGCFFDEETGEWKVYENLDRGMHIIYLQTKEKEEAFEELFSIIDFYIKLDERDR